MKNFNFNIQNNNYNVRILSHEGNVIEMEVNGTSYSVKMKEETKKIRRHIEVELGNRSSSRS